MSDTSAPAHNPRLSSMGRFTVKGTAGDMSDVTDLIERAIDTAMRFIADEYRDPSVEPEGEWLMREARAPFAALAAAKTALATIKQTDAVEAERGATGMPFGGQSL